MSITDKGYSIEKEWDDEAADYVYILYHFWEHVVELERQKFFGGKETHRSEPYNNKTETARGDLAWAKKQSAHRHLPITWNGSVVTDTPNPKQRNV